MGHVCFPCMLESQSEEESEIEKEPGVVNQHFIRNIKKTLFYSHIISLTYGCEYLVFILVLF